LIGVRATWHRNAARDFSGGFFLFVRLREIIAHNKDIAARVEKLERGHERTASVIEILVDDIDHIARDLKQMKNLPSASKRKIGFDL
jgi:hypothetical protein